MKLNLNHSGAAPAKVAPFLKKAEERGLTITMTENGQSYRISSPNPIDDWELWIYYTPGHNGGRCNIYQYVPINQFSKRKRPDTKVTRRMARIVLDNMGDALDRHHEREAARR